MSDRRWDDREPWPWWQRAPVKVADWWYRFLLGPFLTKLPDGTVQGSMTRWAVAAFTFAEVLRLAPIWIHTPSGWVVTMAPLGFPDVLAIFFILFALPINEALNNAAPRDVLALVGKALPGGGATQSLQAPDGSVMTQTAGQPATVDDSAPRVPGAE